MSGTLLKETLKQLGYPKADSLDSLDWIFGNETVVPFLEWFCNSITSENVLSPKDMEEYNTLAESKDGVLEGSQLETALTNLQATEEEEPVSEEEIKKEVDMLTSHCQTYRRRKHNLIQRRNMLSLHHTSRVHSLNKLDKVEANVKRPYKKSLEQCHADNAELNSRMEKMVELVEECNSLYHLPLKPLDEASRPLFLSQLPLTQYIDKEDAFATELTSYTKRQFFEGIAEMTGQGQSSQYEFLDVSNVDRDLLTGGSEEDHAQQCQQLASIQARYPKAKTDLLNAKLTCRSRRRAVDTGEDVLQSLQRGEFSRDITKIRRSYEDVRNSLLVVDRDLDGIMQQDLPTLIKQSTATQVSKILTGDYNLKLARQDYFITNQDKLIQQLISWRSRNEFLTMAFGVEIRHHQDVYRLLSTAHQQLQSHLKLWQERMKMMEDPLLTPAKYQRGTIDSRDAFTTRLYKILDTEESDKEQQLFLTYSALVENAEKLYQDNVDARTAAEVESGKKEKSIIDREKNLQSCERSLYSGSSTCGVPVLTHQEILTAFSKLDGQIKKLSQAIKEICTDIDHKKQVLKNDRTLMKERKLFVYFFSDPQRLRQILEEKAEELRAQQVQ
ncbi:hypothetical protein FSP39_016466 [Pinctada imbricata]|uniref:HAUS augmin-like complex subunit 3 N-terminal domain-containing protein n=1 Tax=Pinctada imbricata TaxID=66713 RepID=A0AA88XVB9_PINIB|nr:hypothetical protein FSP39_016466 [Pinctada imbricata]